MTLIYKASKFETSIMHTQQNRKKHGLELLLPWTRVISLALAYSCLTINS